MKKPADWSVLLIAAMQVCDAMCLFEEHGLLHRDLAARNVLVFSLHQHDRTKVLVKLCDYGLVTEGGGIETANGHPGDDIPWRFVPPEVIHGRRWSSKSDVWSFAVLMWEMFSPGQVPYADDDDDRQVASLVAAGVVLERPGACPEAIYAAMKRCWCRYPEGRPTFQGIKVLLMDAFAESLSECGAVVRGVHV